jgi:hypothetical protein
LQRRRVQDGACGVSRDGGDASPSCAHRYVTEVDDDAPSSSDAAHHAHALMSQKLMMTTTAENRHQVL